MNSGPDQSPAKDAAASDAVPVPVERLLNGLWQQREELGLIADELLAIFRRHGLTPPQDEKTEA